MFGSAQVAALTFAGLSIFLLIRWKTGRAERALLSAVVLTFAFVAAMAFGAGPSTLSMFELVHQIGWIFLLYRILQPAGGPRLSLSIQLLVIFAAILAITVAGILYWPVVVNAPGPTGTWRWVFLSLTANSVIGLVLVEQLIRNTQDINRWRIRYFSIAISLIFGSGLVVHGYSLALLEPATALQQMQPVVLALTTPLFLLGILRNSAQQLHVNLSRDFVFRLGILVLLGACLLGLGVGFYFLGLFAGDINRTIFASLATVAVIGLAVILGSTKIRRYLKVVITKTLFEYKYDYREQWRHATRYLSEPSADYDTSEQATRALMEVLGCTRGALWRLSPQQTLLPSARVNCDWSMPIAAPLTRELVDYYADSNWIIDFKNPPSPRATFAALAELITPAEPRYLIPLFLNDEFIGIVVIGSELVESSLNWEDYDVLRLVANQAASVLQLQQVEKLLAESQQFDTYQQMSAFVVHDVKTVLAQLMLLQQNAERHRKNPDFFDSALRTIGNVVTRLQRLHGQFSGRRSTAAQVVEVNSTLRVAIEDAQGSPRPRLQLVDEKLFVLGNRDQLATIITHLVQNAIQACDKSGEIVVSCEKDGEWCVIEIADTGSGMSQDFIKHRLFTPFDSTKGVVGMGIGAYQALQQVRSMGGDITVDSVQGQGSRFTLRVPLHNSSSNLELNDESATG